MKRIATFFAGWLESLKFFPLGYLIIGAFTVLTIGSTAHWFDFDEELIGAMGLALLLGIGGSLWYLYRVRQGNSEKRKSLWINQICSLLISVGYYFLLMIREDVFSQDLYLFGIFPVITAGTFFFIVMTFRKKETKIWLILKDIIESVFLGSLAGLIVRGGLSGALASIEALFDLDFVNWHRYEYFASFSLIFLAGSFMFTYFLQLYKQNEESVAPSRLRKIFGCYIVLPLLLIYFAIFFAYGLKILITGTWPKGIIVRLGISYFVFGLITYYLTYAEEDRIYKILHQIIFASFLFIALMMSGAIGLRISQYGITFNRYFICAMILVMISFSIFALIRPKERFFFFGTIVFGVAFLSFYGPLNANQASFLSQKQRIIHLVEENGLSLPLQEKSLTSLTGKVVQDIHGAIGGLEDFRYEKWGDFLLTGFETEGEDLNKVSRWGLMSKIYEFLGLPESYHGEYQGITSFYFGKGDMENGPLKVQGFSYLYHLYNMKESASQKNVFRLSPDFERLKDKTIDLNPYVEIFSQDTDAYSYLIEDGENRLLITRVNGTIDSDGEIEINYVNGYYFEK